MVKSYHFLFSKFLNQVLLLRNNGMVTCGETVEEAFYLLNNAVHACITQVSD